MKKNEMFRHIIAIRTAKNNTIYSGTGFFVQADEGEVVLVTATHVARDTTTQTDIWLRNLTTGLPFAFKISDLNPMVMWLYHPVADMAILKVQCGNKIDLSPYVMKLNLFEKNTQSVPERETSLMMYGMPDVYTKLEFAPFTCDSKPASSLWIAHFNVTGCNFNCFMLDKPSTQGFSGGPVISFENPENPICFGIIHGTRQDNTGGKLAIVVHSAYLFELLEYAKNN